MRDAGTAITEAYCHDPPRLNGELLRLCERVVGAQGRADKLEEVAKDVMERAQRQMIRNHYDAEKRGAREEGRNEVIRALSPFLESKFGGSSSGSGRKNRRSPKERSKKNDGDMPTRRLTWGDAEGSTQIAVRKARDFAGRKICGVNLGLITACLAGVRPNSLAQNAMLC